MSVLQTWSRMPVHADMLLYFALIFTTVLLSYYMHLLFFCIFVFFWVLRMVPMMSGYPRQSADRREKGNENG